MVLLCDVQVNEAVFAQIAHQCFQDHRLKEPFQSEHELKSRLRTAMDTVRARIVTHRNSTPTEVEEARQERCFNGRRISVSQRSSRRQWF
jgi:hypothetical protein